MRFFTMEWWQGELDETQPDPVILYQTHMDQIRADVPELLLNLADYVPLHDAQLRTLSFVATTKTLSLGFEVWISQHEKRRFDLHYGDVHALVSTADPQVGLAGPYGYGDVGYDEVDVTDEKQLIHRILFSTGIELAITFGTFHLS